MVISEMNEQGVAVNEALIQKFEGEWLKATQQMDAPGVEYDEKTVHALYTAVSDLNLSLAQSSTRSPLHLHMMTHLSDEMTDYISLRYGTEKPDTQALNMFRQRAEVLFTICLKIMHQAEESTMNNKDGSGHPYHNFHKERLLIERYNNFIAHS